MQALTEDDLRASFVNITEEELEMLAVPASFPFTEWDHTDFYAWKDPATPHRGYIIAELDGVPRGVVLRAANGNSRARTSLCNVCHVMQPADQVVLYTARRSGERGRNGDSIGTYMCSELSCHEGVRLAAPLAPSEFRTSVDFRIDNTKRRAENFVRDIVEAS